MLYKTSSAIPPAFSYVFLLNIIPFFSAVTRIKTDNNIRGATQIIIRVSSHEVVRAMTRPLISCAII